MEFESQDVILYLNTDIESSFQGMVSADILVTSRSSFSYMAALLNDGEVWYQSFWHPPLKNWIIR